MNASAAEAYAPTVRKDPTIMSGSAWKVCVVLGVFIDSVFSDCLWLSLSLALAKPNNCFRPPALKEGCGKVFSSKSWCAEFAWTSYMTLSTVEL